MLSLRISRLLLVVTLGSAGFNACTCEDPNAPPAGRPSLVARFPNGTSLDSDGISTLAVEMLAQNAERAADLTPITLTTNEVGSFADGASEATVTPGDDGVAALTLLCVAGADDRLVVSADNGNATTTFSISCNPPDGDIIIDVDDADCEGRQADGVSTCAITVTVTRETDGGDALPQAGNVTVTVVDADPTNAGDAGDADVLRTAPGNVGQDTVSVTTDDNGVATLELVVPFVAETLGIEYEFEDFTITREVVIEEFQNRAAVEFDPPTAQITSGASGDVTIAVVNAEGNAAGGDRLASISIAGEGVELSVNGGAAAAELTDVQLDGNGEVVVTISTPANLDEPTVFIVTAVYEPLGEADLARTATLNVQVTPEGFAVLALRASPDTLASDGVGAGQVTTVSITFQRDNAAVPGGTVELSIPGESQPVIFFADESAGTTTITLAGADFDSTGVAEVDVEVVDGVAPAVARVIAESDDGDGNVLSEEVLITITREPILQAIVFESIAPAGSIGVQGGSLSSSALVSFRLVDDQGNPMPNVAVSFERNPSSDPTITVQPTDISDAAGLASTVLSAGTIPGPVTVIAIADSGLLDVAGNAIRRLGQSDPIPIVGGLPSAETSSLTCNGGAAAVREPYSVSCSAVLVDRFSNTVDGNFVQFSAEGGAEQSSTASAGGTATVTVASTEEQTALTDMLGWSYGAILPNDATDVDNGTTFSAADATACFDGRSDTVCDVIALCQDPALDVLCPLPPGCLADAQVALNVLNNPPSVLDFANNTGNAQQRVRDYIRTHRSCGFPIGCFTGDLDGLALSVADGDECPAFAGCFDFTGTTECPQDGVRTILAATRGAEAFSDVDGNGIFDFDDVNANGRHDEGEPVIDDRFTDLPEPFLDRNDNCFRDDLTDTVRFDNTPIFKVVNTDQFSDVSDNDVFGFQTSAGVTNTNLAWDADTQIILTDHILEIEGAGAGLIVGERCTTAGVNHTCANGAASLCIETSSGNIASCSPPNLDGTRPSAAMAVRWFDGNGNCPSENFSEASSVTVDGLALLTGDADITLDESVCNFGEAFNPIMPFCKAVPFTSAPILDVTIARDCGDNAEIKISTLFFKLGGVTSSRSFSVTCP